jgi:GYF domain 2
MFSRRGVCLRHPRVGFWITQKHNSKKLEKSMPNYYLHRDGQNHGPYSDAQMHQFVTSGQVAQSELICPEGGSDWVPASTLLAGSDPRLMTGVPTAVSRPAESSVLAITQEHVEVAWQNLKTPFLGMLFSAALPVLLWAAKSDTENGVGTSGRHGALKELAKQNTDLLPLAIVIGLIGVAVCAVWFAKARKKAKILEAAFNRQQIGS